MKWILFAEILLFLLLGVGMVQVNYLPIRRLTRNLPLDATDDELADISRYIERMNSDLSEQKLLLMDYLMSNMLCGAPVPPGQLDRMGLSAHAGSFCVMVLFHRGIKTEDRMELTAHIQKSFNATLMITDILGTENTVVICLLPTPDADAANAVSVAVRDWLTTHVAFPLELNVGPVVPSVNDIGRSYAACIGAPFASEPATADSAQTQTDAQSSASQIARLQEDVLAFIQKSFADPDLSQVSVADRFGISTYSLSRLFKNHVGIGFSEYVTSKRLEAAKALLLSTDKSVNEIAMEVGIQNASYFSRLFKTNVGRTPMQYRSDGKETDRAQ